MPPQDALTSPVDPSLAGAMQVQILGQIRDNLSLLHKKLEKTDESVTDMRTRVIMLEARDERLERAEKAIEQMDGKLDLLLRDKDMREGASKVFVGIKGWWPVVLATLAAACSVASALYLGGRAAGVIGKAPDHSIHALP